jgi:hypothetical protein
MERVERDIQKKPLLLNVGCLDPWVLTALHQREKIGDLALLAISQDTSYSLNGRNCLRGHLGIASGYNDQRFRIESEGPSDHLPRLKVSPVGNRTGIDDSDIYPVSKGDEVVSSLFQGSHKRLGFKLVDLTTECGN